MSVNSIALRGLTSVPSDYDCADGELQVCHNMVNGKGVVDAAALSEIESYDLYDEAGTESVSDVTFAGLVFVHKTSDGDVYIGADSDGYLYFYNNSGSPCWQRLPLCFAGEGSELTSVGNILIVCLPSGSSSSGIHYVRYKEGRYKYLGNGLPDLDIRFSLMLHDGDVAVPGYSTWSTNSYIKCTSVAIGGNSLSVDDLLNGSINEHVYGLVNSVLAALRKEELYAYPFFVRYGYRMYDGSYTMVSSPVLLIPSDWTNIQAIAVDKCHGVNPVEKNLFMCYVPAKLMMKIATDPSVLSDWNDIITSVDFFISPCINGYVSSGNLGGKDAVNHASAFAYDFSTTGIWQASGMHTIQKTEASLNLTFSLPSYSTDDDYLLAFRFVFNSRTGNLNTWVEESSNFWLLRSVNVNDLNKYYHSNATDLTFFRLVSENNNGILDLFSEEGLVDYESSRSILVPRKSNVYNGRLNLVNVAKNERSSIPTGMLTCMSNEWLMNDKAVFLIEEDNSVNKVTTSGLYIEKELSSYSGFFFYPNVHARYLKLRNSYLPLKLHPNLTGAYYFNGYFGTETISDKPDIFDVAEKSVSERNVIYSSRADNPFSFPSRNVSSIGDGEVLSIATSTKALSEGTAFGSQPLYAFCTDGIWALSLDNEGIYVATQPVSREVILHSDAILGIDHSILFLTRRGLMELSGSETRLLSGMIQERFSTFDVSDLPGWVRLHGLLGHDTTENGTLESDDFLGYISEETRLAFDYENYRIWVYNPGVPGSRGLGDGDVRIDVAFVYDIGSGQWSTCDCRFVSSVAGWPGTFVNIKEESGGIVVGRFSKDNEVLVGNGYAFYVTRPLKLGEPDVMKTIRTLIERGRWLSGNKDSKEICLWGSRDMVEWFAIKDVRKGVKISGIGGSPYKYFVVAGWAKLDVHGDVVSRLDVEFVEKYVNKLR